MKFRIGDKVRVIGKGPDCQNYRHKTYTIESIWHGCYHPYQLHISDRYPVFHGRELEKAA
jgi:hypothetical protein